MLTVSPMRCANAEEHSSGAGGDEAMGGFDGEFDFAVDAGALLDDIDFGDFFLGLEDGDALPDLEVDPAEIFAEFEAGGGTKDQEVPTMGMPVDPGEAVAVGGCDGGVGEETIVLMDGTGEEKEENDGTYNDEEIERMMAAEAKSDDGDGAAAAVTKSPSSSSSQEVERRQKSSKNSQGKKKAKVDWTPELHRRFVQAVEQLGVDKAVPSRILELMGIDSLTRHNIASHLQKYRSHRKHLLAREAEAASWSQRRQIYTAGGGNVKRDVNAWTVPTIGFPPSPVQHFRPLHVWGHPTMDAPRIHMWPRHLVPRSPTPPWAPQPHVPPPSDPSFWHPHYMRGPAHLPTQGTPCMAMQMPATRFPAPLAPGIVLYPMYRPITPRTLASNNADAQLQVHAQPPTESVDAAIGDVLSKPWLPLPLGLKPPSLDSVMGELQRQGVENVLPACV